MDTLEKLENCGMTFNDHERQLFVNKNNEVLTYLNDKGVKAVKFSDDKFRLKCIENFLAAHSFEIGNPSEPRPDESILYISFNGDQEVSDAMLNPLKNKDKLVWKLVSDFDENSNMRKIAEEMKVTDKFFVNVIIRVNKFDEDTLMYLFPFKFKPFELYTEVILPWILENKDKKPLIVYLSCFQYDVFFPKDGNGLKVDFYPTPNGHEPIIIDEDKKCSIIANIGSRVDQLENPDEDDIMVFRFKGGDKDILNAWAFSSTLKIRYI